MFSVELLADSVIEDAIRDEWRRLTDAGLPSAGRNPAVSSRPHVTLAVRDRLDAAGLDALGAMLPLPLSVGGVLLFGHRGRFVLARQIVPTAELLGLHARLAATIGPPEPRYANTAPGAWSPHITLARRLDAEQVSTALRALRSVPRSGEAAGLRIWDADAKVVTTLR